MNFFAYNARWPRHAAIQAQASRWQKRGLLTPAQTEAVATAFPLNEYRPPFFIWLGLFVFTVLGALMATAFIGFICRFHVGATLTVSLAVGLTLLELLVAGKRLYHSGPDNALLYLELLGAVVLIFYLLFYQSRGVLYATGPVPGTVALTGALALTLVVFALATLRYADRLVAAATYLNALLLLGNLLLLFSSGLWLLPFGLAAASAGAYAWSTRALREPRWQAYHACWRLLRGLGLATAYLAVNYLVVREGVADLLAAQPTPALPLPLTLVLGALTAAIPLWYLIQGLRRPDRTWLWLGLLTAAFSVYTVRYYRSLLPPELAALLAGALLTSLAVWATRYLRTTRHGLTSAPDEATDPGLNLESLIVAETAHAAPVPTATFRFGGGSTGGGGATGSY